MGTVLEYLKKTVKENPNSIACRDENDELTYIQLWQYSDSLIEVFYEGETCQKPVAIVALKSVWLLVIIWAVIKSGRPYSVVDPMNPKERIHNILCTLDTDTIVTEKKYNKKIGPDLDLIDIDQLKERIITPVQVGITKKEICDITPLYIMFTSGTTGIPKGVVVNHRAVVDFIDEFTEVFGINKDDVIGNQAPWDFDVSVKDIFSAAKKGATLAVIPRKLFSFPKKLVEYIEEQHITTLIWSVSALRIISSNDGFDYCKPRSISKVIFSGEIMPPKHYNKWREQYPSALFANVYGPTEITCNCTYYIQEGVIGEDAVIPIGKPFGNEKVFLLSDDNQIIKTTETGKIGEICVSGTAVAMGYYGNEAATREVFVQNPCNSKYIEIIYRTGDLGQYKEDDTLLYVGRKDNQIKYMGHRIEIEEIEKALNSLSDIKETCCIYKGDTITAFIVGNIEEKAIVTSLQKKVPNYMIPTKYVYVENLPLNSHGKVDRKQLQEL